MKLLIVDEVIIAGGVETLRRNLIPALAKLVDEIIWVLPTHGMDAPRRAVHDCGNVTIHPLSSQGGIARIRESVARRLPSGIRWGLVNERLRRLARLHGSDVCMTTCVFDQEVPDVRLPVVGWVSDINPALPEQTQKNICKWMESSAVTIGVSEFTCSELKRAAPGSSSKIQAVPLAGLREAKTCGEVTASSFYYAAAPNKHKGHLPLLEAARGLAGQGVTFRMTLSGAGMDCDFGEMIVIREFLERHSSLLAKRVVLAGDVDEARYAQLLAEASCVVLPSSYEGFGLPLIEALTYGKPVICSDIPSFREQVARYGCEDMVKFVPAGDASALENAMAAHLDGWSPAVSPEVLNERLGRWTWADAASRCRTLLEGVVGNG